MKKSFLQGLVSSIIHLYLVKKYNARKYIREHIRDCRMYIRRKLYKMPSNDISLFCNNCTAGCVCHDMGLRFNSPTVNLIIEPSDFVEFLSNLEYYSNKEVLEYPQGYEKYNCPTGIIDNKVKIYFIHYNSFEEARAKWEARCKRINIKKCYFILSERDGCSFQDLENFDKLDNCVKKVEFVHEQYPSLENQFVIGPDVNNPLEAAVMTDWIGFGGARIYDSFNWIEWLK